MIIGSRNGMSAEIGRQSRLAEQIARAQVEISGGKRILAPSDDPIGSARVSQINVAQMNEMVWSANAGGAAALAARADSTMGSIVTAAGRAIELMTLARSGTASADNRRAYALELTGIANDIRAMMVQKDPLGQSVFPIAAPLSIPVGDGLHVTATGQRDQIFGSGPDDFATVLDGAVAALAISDDALRSAATSTSMTQLQASSNRAIDARSVQGSRMNLIESISERLANSKLTLTEERGEIEDTNRLEAIARINNLQLTLDAAQGAFARINRSTLFDLIR